MAEATPGQRLRSLIADRGWESEAAFAREIGIDKVTLSRLINGETDLRRSPNLSAIAEALETTEPFLLYGLRSEAAVIRERAEPYGASAVEEAYKEGVRDALQHLEGAVGAVKRLMARDRR